MNKNDLQILVAIAYGKQLESQSRNSTGLEETVICCSTSNNDAEYSIRMNTDLEVELIVHDNKKLDKDFVIAEFNMMEIPVTIVRYITETIMVYEDYLQGCK